MIMRLFISAGVGLSLLAGTAVNAHQANQPGGQWRILSATEIEALMGHKFGGINRFNEPFLMEFNQDQTAVGQAHTATTGYQQANPYTRGSDTGRWWVDGNRICFKMTQWLAARTTCFGLATNGAQYRYVDGGPPNSTVYFDSVPWSGGTWSWQ